VGLVIPMAVNDAAVMRAWSTDQKCDGTIIEFYADHACEVTKALGLVMEDQKKFGNGTVQTITASPWKFGNLRCKRFAMVIENGVIKMCNICAGPGDPAGDDNPELSFVEEVMKSL